MHDHSLKEHQELRELLYQVDQTKVDDIAYPEKLKVAVDALFHHIVEEEAKVLPVIERHFTLEQRQRLGNAFEIHKVTAVTRPHPDAPLQGPFAAAANIVTKPFDKLRDAVRDATTHEKPMDQ